MINVIPQIGKARMNWHQASVEVVMAALRTGPAGLDFEEAGRRALEFGPNELVEMKKRSPLGIFLSQFADFMIIVLVLAALVAGIIGDGGDAAAILAIVVLNAVVGFIQEFRAEKAIAALKEMAAPTAAVTRGGMTIEVPASTLVPGDLVILEPGRIVPADMRIAESFRLRIVEAVLTGEAVPVEKSASVLTEESPALGDMENLAFKGTLVSYGKGKGVIVATGMGTEFGKIAAMLQQEKEVRTPLQKRLARFGRRLALFILAACLVIFNIGILRGEPVLLMFLTAVSLAVAAIPEALPAVVTIALAIGAKNMVSRKALIRKLPAVETLGSVTFICSDKTGTLTENRMSVEKIYTAGKIIGMDVLKKTMSAGMSVNQDNRNGHYALPDAEALMTAFSLNNDATADEPERPTGDPTEVALYNAARQSGFDRYALGKFLEKVGEIPFDAERRCMTTIHRINMPLKMHLFAGGIGEAFDDGFISFTKGAVEALIDKSTSILSEEGVVPLDRGELIRVNERMASEGLRVLCIGMRRWRTFPDISSSETVEEGLTILGLAGIMDPPRQEAKEAVALCKGAGIQVVMITGDHPATAVSIAKRLGISDQGREEIITGNDLDRLSDDEFRERVGRIRVYARVAPEQKLKIIKALQDRGEYVAMTGDGINDAPALKKADIGVAMNVTGTDAAKESADMVLLDDNFASIVNAVEEGRKIYDNIRKFIKYLLTTNSGEVWTLFLAPVIGLPVPLLPIQILWVNLITDGLPALALSVEPAEGDVMKRLPRPPGESIFSHGLGLHALWVGLLMGVTALIIQSWALGSCGAHWQTMVFTLLCLTQLGHVLAIRSETQSLFTMGLLSNKPLLAAVVCGLVLQLAVVYCPALNSLFKTVPLTGGELTLIIALSSVVFFSVEVEKLFKRRRRA